MLLDCKCNVRNIQTHFACVMQRGRERYEQEQEMGREREMNKKEGERERRISLHMLHSIVATRPVHLMITLQLPMRSVSEVRGES